MSAYLIVDTKINNVDAYEEYKKLAKPLAEKYGGVYLARGGEINVCESDLWAPSRIVIIEFPNLKEAQTFVDSDEYAPIKKIRHANAESTVMIVDGS
ncbi:MAG: DUF1330 domain-containing protein [Pseudomonadales bacterium]|jgi:uncharacterized protein (DUF1330 family)